jgi:hypothetical protein
MNLSEVLLPLSRISLLGRMMSDRMTFSRPNCFLISLARPLPSWPSPPVSNDSYMQTDSLHRERLGETKYQYDFTTYWVFENFTVLKKLFVVHLKRSSFLALS